MPHVYITGVYCWENQVNQKVYVGGAYESLEGRKEGYLKAFAKGRCHNRYLLNAWLKYGAENFVWKVLERCHPDDVEDRENFWLAKTRAYDKKCGYNICKVAGSRLGVKHTEEACAKMSASKKGRPNGRLGCKHTEEAKARISATKTGVPLKEETKQRMSAVRKGKKQTEQHRENSRKSHWSKGPRAAEIIAGIKAKTTGRKYSEERCRNIREGRRKQMAEKRCALLAAQQQQAEPPEG